MKFTLWYITLACIVCSILQANELDADPISSSYEQWIHIDLYRTFPILAPFLKDSSSYNEYQLRLLLECAANKIFFKDDSNYKYVCEEYLNRANGPRGKDWVFQFHVGQILFHSQSLSDISTQLKIDETVLKFVNDLEPNEDIDICQDKTKKAKDDVEERSWTRVI